MEGNIKEMREVKGGVKMLQPCPACGSVTMREVHTVHKKNGSVMYYGRCACGCKTHPYMSIERAMDAWNAKYEKAKAKKEGGADDGE